MLGCNVLDVFYSFSGDVAVNIRKYSVGLRCRLDLCTARLVTNVCFKSTGLMCVNVFFFRFLRH